MNVVTVKSGLKWHNVLSECVYSLQQTITEHVHLNNAEELQTQTGESGDVVQFLKYKAERGDVDSQVFITFSLIHIIYQIMWLGSRGLFSGWCFVIDKKSEMVSFCQIMSEIIYNRL